MTNGLIVIRQDQVQIGPYQTEIGCNLFEIITWAEIGTVWT